MRLKLAIAAAVALGAIVSAAIAISEAPHESSALPAPEALWLPVPDLRGLGVPQAIARVESEGWKRAATVAEDRGRYRLRGWVAGEQRGFVKSGWGRVACGGRLTAMYRLDIGVAKTLGDCGRSPAVPPFFAFPTEDGWAAVWGFAGVIELWSPSDGYTTADELAGGTCSRPAKSRAFHLGPSIDPGSLRNSTWHLSKRRSKRCVTHLGDRDYVANDLPAADTTVRRRVLADQVEVAFVSAPADRFEVSVQPTRRGNGTLIHVHGPAIGGSSPIGAHVRPGTCRLVSGPEHGFELDPDGDNSRAGGSVVIPVAYASFTAKPHVIELHGNVNYSDGVAVVACAGLTDASVLHEDDRVGRS